MLVYSIRGMKLELSLGGRTKLCALTLVLYPVLLSSGNSLHIVHGESFYNFWSASISRLIMDCWIGRLVE